MNAQNVTRLVGFLSAFTVICFLVAVSSLVFIVGQVKQMSCNHAYSKTWEFGPILLKDGESEPYWWFYKRCSKCGKVELYSSWKLNLKPRTEINDRDLYIIKAEYQR